MNEESESFGHPSEDTTNTIDTIDNIDNIGDLFRNDNDSNSNIFEIESNHEDDELLVENERVFCHNCMEPIFNCGICGVYICTDCTDCDLHFCEHHEDYVCSHCCEINDINFLICTKCDIYSCNECLKFFTCHTLLCENCIVKETCRSCNTTSDCNTCKICNINNIIVFDPSCPCFICNLKYQPYMQSQVYSVLTDPDYIHDYHDTYETHHYNETDTDTRQDTFNYNIQSDEDDYNNRFNYNEIMSTYNVDDVECLNFFKCTCKMYYTCQITNNIICQDCFEICIKCNTFYDKSISFGDICILCKYKEIQSTYNNITKTFPVEIVQQICQY